MNQVWNDNAILNMSGTVSLRINYELWANLAC